MNLRRLVKPAILAVVVLIAAVVAWNIRTSPKRVETAIVREAPLIAEWSAVGYVESRSANVTSPAVGRIVRVLVDEGDAVQVGQLLATLSNGAEQAALDAQVSGERVGAAQLASSKALLREALSVQAGRERHAAAELSAAQQRLQEVNLSANRAAVVGPEAVETAKAEVETSAALLRDLERGSLPEEIARVQADLNAADAALLQARSEASRVELLEREGAASRRDLELAQTALRTAEAVRTSRSEALKLTRRGSREDLIASARSRLRAAESRVRTAQADLAQGKIELRRVGQAKAAVDAARSAIDEIRAGRIHSQSLDHDSAAASARVSQSAAVARQASAQLGDRRIIASFGGIVGRRLSNPGDLAAPGQPILTIVEPARTWIAAEVDEQDIGAVRTGQKVVITVPAFANRDFEGAVERTGARVVRVRISVAKQDRILMKPGMEVHISGKTTVSRRSLLVPPDAVNSDSGGSFAWIVDSGRCHRRVVRAGLLTGAGVEVSAGLKAGDHVIISSKDDLVDGLNVADSTR